MNSSSRRSSAWLFGLAVNIVMAIDSFAPPPVDADHCARGIAAVIARQVQSGRDDLLGLAVPRNGRLQLRFLFLGPVSGDVRAKRPGKDGIHANLRAEFLRMRHRERI